MRFIVLLKIFGFMLFLFTPSFAVMLFAAFVLNSGWWFQVLGLPVLILNGLIIFGKRGRTLVGRKFMAIAGTK